MTSTTTTTTTALSSSTTALTAVQIPCCLCGTMIFPNAANQCSTCLAQQVDMTQIVQRGPDGTHGDIVIYQCRECRRYARTEKHYQVVEPESAELLALCLKHIPALSGVSHTNNHALGTGSGAVTRTSRLHVVDAGWVYTEPHSMRFKIRLTLRTEVHQVLVQQRVVVQLICKFRMCPDCNREFTNRTWHAVVQVRQRRDDISSSTSSSTSSRDVGLNDDNKNNRNDKSNRKGLAALEMSISKSAQIRKHVTKIDAHRDGFDFYFLTLTQAQTFANFLQRVSPMRVKTSSKMVSQDLHNNTANMKYTVICDMVPFWKHDLVLISKAARRDRLAGRLALVTKVSSSTIHFIDAAPTSKRPSMVSGPVTGPANSSSNTTTSMWLAQCQMELGPEPYYKNEKHYSILQSAHQLVRFVVMDVELVGNRNSSEQAQSVGPMEDEEEKGEEDSSSTTRGREINQHNHSSVPASTSRYALAMVQVARESDLAAGSSGGGDNNNNIIFYDVITHLGLILTPGDICLGYDLTTSVLITNGGGDGIGSGNGQVSTKPAGLNNQYRIPDVVLVQKVSATAQQAASEAAMPSSSASSLPSSKNEISIGSRPVISKKMERRRRRKEGKRNKELEQSAARMGFVPPVDDTTGDDDDEDDMDGFGTTTDNYQDTKAGASRNYANSSTAPTTTTTTATTTLSSGGRGIIITNTTSPRDEGLSDANSPDPAEIIMTDDNNNNNNDDDDYYMDDPVLAAELSALEQDLDALDLLSSRSPDEDNDQPTT